MNRKLRCLSSSFIFLLLFPIATLQGNSQQQKTAATNLQTDSMRIVDAKKTGATTVTLELSNHQRMLLDFYGDNIFRLFYDKSGGPLRDPVAEPPARILTDDPRQPVSKLDVTNKGDKFIVTTGGITIVWDKASTRMTIRNRENKAVVETLAPVLFDKKKTVLKLKENPQEYFYGGGVQNGRFSHKGKSIAIENQNSWTDGGVASPTPYYWSNAGYGLLWYTF